MTITAFNRHRFNLKEYSRYGENGGTLADESVINLRVAIDGHLSTSDIVTATLIEEATGATVGMRVTPITDRETTRLDVNIDLKTDCWDPRYFNRHNPDRPDTHVYRARQGWYHMHVVATDSVGSVTASMDTERFPISIITVAEFKRRWLFGFPALAKEVLEPVEQPKTLGFRIATISSNLYKGRVTFTYDPDDHSVVMLSSHIPDGFGAPPTYLDPEGAGTVAVYDAVEDDYCLIEYDGWDLPDTLTVEDITFDNARTKDDVYRESLWEATGWLEAQLHCYLEPTRVTTDEDLDPFAHQKMMIPVDYRKPEDMLDWLKIKIPARPLLEVDRIIGKMNDGQVLEVPHDWFKITRQTGLVKFVPRYGAIVSWQFYSANFIQFLYGGFQTVPNFWHFATTVGIPDFFEGKYAPVRQMIAQRAMVQTLTTLGRGAIGQNGSTSVSKDGVSDSRSSTASGATMLYGAEIAQFEKELLEQIPKAKQRILGVVQRTFLG